MRHEGDNLQCTHSKIANSNIATLLRGVSNEFIAHLDSNNYVWFNPSIQIDNDIYNRISSSLLIGDKIHYLGLEPDILGEYFVIRHFSKMIEGSSNGKDNILALLSELWSHKPDNFVFMLSMLLQDFDDCTETNLLVYKILLNTKPINSLNLQSWIAWSIYRNFICNPLFLPKISISEKEKFFLEIQTSVGDLDMEGVCIWLSTITMNFTSYFGQQKETNKLIRYLEITHSYTLKYPHSQLIMAQYVNALRNGILDGLVNFKNDQINKYFNGLEVIIAAFSQNEYINYIYSLVLCDIIRQLSKSLNFIASHFELCNYALDKARGLCELYPENHNFHAQLNGIVCAIAVGYAKGGRYDRANQFREESASIKEKFISNYQIVYDNYLMNLDLARHGKNLLETESQLLVYYDSAEEVWEMFRKERDIALYFAKTNWEFVCCNDIFDGVRISDSNIQRMKKNLREIEKDFGNDWEFIRYIIAGESDFLQSNSSSQLS